MKIDSSDLTWIMVSTALVMLMTPGLALFYGGMVRRKNVTRNDYAKFHCARCHHTPMGILGI